jgi:hypothetical protein
MTQSNNQHFWHEVETKAAAYSIWALWMDVARWGEWDQGLKDASMEGAMTLGKTGFIVDHSGRRSPFTITELVKGQSYCFATRLPFGELTVRRSILQSAPCRFRHDVRFVGAGGWLLSHILGPGFRKQLPPTMAMLSALAIRAPQDERTPQ